MLRAMPRCLSCSSSTALAGGLPQRVDTVMKNGVLVQ
jgi:hypothetical protein